jgi:hypothetical protein
VLLKIKHVLKREIVTVWVDRKLRRVGEKSTRELLLASCWFLAWLNL